MFQESRLNAFSFSFSLFIVFIVFIVFSVHFPIVRHEPEVSTMKLLS